MSDESLRISYSTAGDLKSSLIHVIDVKDLKLALAKVRTMEPINKSKIKLIEQRIRQLTGCRHKGCKKRATTVHCDWCKHPSCDKHKGPGNHGGFPGKDAA